MLLHVLRKLAESIGLRVNGAFKGSYGVFIFVAGINNQHFRVGNQVVPFFRIDISTGRAFRVNPVNAQGDNFFFQFYLGAVKSLLVTGGFFVFNVSKTLIGT